MAILAVMATGLAACGDSGDDGEPAPTTAQATTSTSAPPAVSTTTGPGEVTFTASALQLANSEESDNAFRLLVDSTAAEAVVVLEGIPAPNRVVLVCPAAELDRPVRSAGTCSTPAAGEAVRVPLFPAYRGVEVLQVGVAGPGPGGNVTVVSRISVRYRPASRDVTLRLPPLPTGEGGRPSFVMSPVGPGTYRATATWTGAGTAELAVDIGPGGVTRSSGGPGISVSGSHSPPVEATLRFANVGDATILRPVVTATMP